MSLRYFAADKDGFSIYRWIPVQDNDPEWKEYEKITKIVRQITG